MSVTLRKRKNTDGSISLLLDIYHDGKRSYEFLKSLKLDKPANLTDRAANKDKLDLAERIKIERAHQLAANDYSMSTESGKKTDVVKWMQAYVDKYDKKDVRNMQGALNRFKAFLIKKNMQGLVFGRLDEQIISDFQEQLIKDCQGEGSSSYFARYKKMMKKAYKEKIINRNPATDVPTKQGRPKKKDTLSMEEIKLLSTTHTESVEIKRAFLFSCLTGLRWIDIKGLTWAAIRNKSMTVVQSKTEREIFINLNDTALKLLGEPGKPKEFVFDLPTANGANKTVKAWVKRAGIAKKITWHNARHSFGTNLVFLGTDVIAASSLLGHSTLQYTSRYVKAAAELKERATDKLNFKL
ncbi:MAG: site-specific integrase [Mucilaginibacter sp.]